MSSPTHILVPSGKADADAMDYSNSFFDQIESLRSEQIHLSQKLLSERATNTRVRNDLAFTEDAFLKCAHIHDESVKKLADVRVQRSQLQMDVLELQKELKAEEEFIANVLQRIEELKKMNEMASETLRLNSPRTAQFHKLLAGYTTSAPIAKDSESMIAELARLKQENHSLRMKLAKYDARLIEAAEEGEEERKRLELAVVEAKSRLSALKAQLSSAESNESAQLKQLKRELDVQLATNDALQAEIQGRERSLFGNVLGSDVWPEL